MLSSTRQPIRRSAFAIARRTSFRSLSTETESQQQPSHPPIPQTPPQRPNSPGLARSRTLFNPTPRTSAPTSRSPPPFLPYLSPTFGQNQRLPVPDETRALLERIVGEFHAPIRYAFAYGSGVFTQAGYSAGQRPMLDFVFAVSHPGHWHSINMQQNPHHYPFFVRSLGSDFVSRVQDVNPGVWFNAFVPMQDATIKYGVTTVDNLCSDLLNWNTLYLAGRMHKPIRIIKDDPRVRLTQQVNLVSAARVALLMLPERFNSHELFMRIAGFSYSGDPRMMLPAENHGKVANIVNAQTPQFVELYRRLLLALPGLEWDEAADVIRQDLSPTARALHLRKLPSTLLNKVETQFAARGDMPTKKTDESAYWAKMAGDAAVQSIIQTETNNIVRYPALVQSFKGLVSAGPLKSARYSAAKIGKWWTGSKSSVS